MVVHANEGFQWLSDEVVTEEDVSRTIVSMRPTQALRIKTEALTHAADVWEATFLDS